MDTWRGLEEAIAEQKRRGNVKPIILDLCGGTGAWSRPWLESGEYDVRVITLPEHDVRTYQPPEGVYGILAAPPCTYFCRMRMCRGRPTKEELAGALEVVKACMGIIWDTQPAFWAMENPVGWLKDWLGEPALKFQPCEYGDPWTKATWIWGKFNKPMKLFPVRPKGSWVKEHSSSGQKGIAKSKTERSITPPGFAKAFFEANRIRDNRPEGDG